MDARTWHDVVDALQRRRAVDGRTLQEYRELLCDGTAEALTAALQDRSYRAQTPARLTINKSGGSRKTLYLLARADELLMRVLNAVLQPRVEALLSPSLHSFRRGRGAKSAFASLLADPLISRRWSVHLDIQDYFNSIDTARLLRHLPAPIREDAPVMHAVTAYLGVDEVVERGVRVEDDRHGVMAGTPLAPLLSNLYLRDLDAELDSLGVRSARYADDVLVLGDRSSVERAEALLRRWLAERGLLINERKTRHTAPGEPWDFLGLSYDGGEITLSAHTRAKLEARVRRRARSLLRHSERRGIDAAHTCRLFARTLNRKLYGAGGGATEFSWATWFFPVLTTTRHLHELDRYVQEQMRFAACGLRRARSRMHVPYELLREAGYIPLVSAYHTWHAGAWDGERMLARLERTG